MNDALLIGSRALRYWFRHSRKPADDFDFFVDQHQLDEWNLNFRHQCNKIIEIGDDTIQFLHKTGLSLGFDNNKHESVQMFMELNEDMPELQIFDIKCKIASPETLMAIKRSHLHHRHNWHKHIADYAFLKSKGVTMRPAHEEAMRKRMEERDARGDFKIASGLNISNDEFFKRSDGPVRRKFIHDDLHQAVAYYDRPLFMSAKYDQSKALLSEELFHKFDHTRKCRLVREEAYVIALERFIIPKWYNQHVLREAGVFDETPQITNEYADKAYSYALMRISTDLTKGWFRDFAIENFWHISKPDINYVAKFVCAFDNDKLRLKDG